MLLESVLVRLQMVLKERSLRDEVLECFVIK